MSWRRVPFRSPKIIRCRRRSRAMAFGKSSLPLPRRRVAHAMPVFVSSRFTARTAISFTNFFRRSAINATTITAARLKIARACCARSCRPCAASWPKGAPLFVRISATDWIDGGWDLEQSIALARELKQLGVDLIDCSSGGSVPHAKIPVGAGYQTPFAQRIRDEAEILTGAVGMITAPAQAEHIINTGQADAILMAREFLREPYWPLRAAEELRQSVSWPVQYLRAAPRDAHARVPVNLDKLKSCFEHQHAIPERR